MNRESLDTNVLLRFTLNDLPAQYQRATELIFGSAGKKFLVQDTAFIEYVHALSAHYHKTRPQITEMVTYLVQLREIVCNEEAILTTCAVYIDHPALSFEDCYLSTMAQLSEAVPLYTFDKKLAAQHQSVKLL